LDYAGYLVFKVNKIALASVFLIILLVAAASVLVSSQLIPDFFTLGPTQTSSPTPLQTDNPTNQSTGQPSWAEQPTTIALSGSPPILFSAKVLNFTIAYSNTTHEGTNMVGHDRTMYPQNVYPVTAYVELTFLGKPQDAPWDILIESFSVKVSSDTGLSASYTAVMGTNVKETTIYAHDPPPSMYMGVSRVDFRMNMTVGQQAQLQMGDDLYSSSPGNSGLWQNGQPNTLTVTLLRGDWTANDNGHWLTIVNPEKETALQTLTLERIGDGFSYSALST
jgi:hypothetical protein